MQKKELELIEAAFPEINKLISKADTYSSITFIGALILLTTMANAESVKLPILDFPVKSIHAVYLLFSVSLWELRVFLILYMKKKILRHRYLYLFKKEYNDVPFGIHILFNSSSTGEYMMFGNKLQHTLFAGALMAPFAILFLWLHIKLITMTLQMNFDFIFFLYYTSMLLYLSFLVISMLYDKIKPDRFKRMISIDK